MRGLRLFLVGSIVWLVTVASASAIGLDGTFATGGKFMTTFADSGNPNSAAARVFVQPSGRIVAIGTHQQDGVTERVSGIAIVGLTSLGAIDGSFGNAGKILLWSPTEQTTLADAARLDDGSFLILYHSNIPRLVKYTANGQIDGSFNADVVVPFVTGEVRLALGSNSKIYALVQRGLFYSIIRVNANGSRDETFGPNGVRSLDLMRIRSTQRTIRSLLEVEGGKILVTGNFEPSSQWEQFGFAARFDSEMNLDRTFGRQGIFQLAIPGGYTIGVTRAVALADGRYILGGYYTFLGSYAMLVRLTNRGRYDAPFGTAGISLSSIEDINSIYGVAIAQDGKIVVSGSTSDKTFPTVQQLWVARFSSNGARESFQATTFISGRNAGGADVALQPDGKMVAVGSTQNATGSNSQFAVARFVP